MNETRKQITIAILKPSLCIYPERVKKVYEMIEAIGMIRILHSDSPLWPTTDSEEMLCELGERRSFPILRYPSASGIILIARSAPRKVLLPSSRVYNDEWAGRSHWYWMRLIADTSSQVALEGVNAVAAWRALIGPTHVTKARSEEPTSIRGQFAFSDTKNCVHGSDSENTAMEELLFFFPDYQPTRDLE